MNWFHVFPCFGISKFLSGISNWLLHFLISFHIYICIILCILFVYIYFHCMNWMLPSFDYNMLCKFLLASEDLLNKSLMCIKETECNSRLMYHCWASFSWRRHTLRAQNIIQNGFNMENGRNEANVSRKAFTDAHWSLQRWMIRALIQLALWPWLA